ncbi:MAG: AI-2E family transporter [Planctomycetales bacterium]|nr:AI-2E family transporter [Planctomycetales bacterium]
MVRKRNRKSAPQPNETSPSAATQASDEPSQSTETPVTHQLPSFLPKTTSVTKIASLLVLVVIIIVILILFYRVMAGFVLPLFLAALCSVLFRPIHAWMLNLLRGRETTAAALTTAAILCIVFCPMVIIAGMAIGEWKDSSDFGSGNTGTTTDKIVGGLHRAGEWIPTVLIGGEKLTGRPFESDIVALDLLFEGFPTEVPSGETATGLIEPLTNARGLLSDIEFSTLSAGYIVEDIPNELIPSKQPRLTNALASASARIMCREQWIVFEPRVVFAPLDRLISDLENARNEVGNLSDEETNEIQNLASELRMTLETVRRQIQNVSSEDQAANDAFSAEFRSVESQLTRLSAATSEDVLALLTNNIDATETLRFSISYAAFVSLGISESAIPEDVRLLKASPQSDDANDHEATESPERAARPKPTELAVARARVLLESGALAFTNARIPLLETLDSDLELAQDYVRIGSDWEALVRGASVEASEELKISRTEAEHKLSEFRKTYPRLNETWQSVRAQIHGGSTRMLATDIFFPTADQIARREKMTRDYAQSLIPSMGGKVTAIAGQFVANVAIMILGLFYFLKDGPGMIRAIMRLSPLDDRYEKELLSEFDSVSRAVVLATLLSAFAQGLLAGIGYYFAGFDAVLFMTMATMLIAMVPVVGAAAVWVPACIWLAVVDQRVSTAIYLAIYGATVVSMVDNLIKPFVLHGQSNLHPLLALLSVLGGVTALGPIGIIVGPMVVSFLQALLNMLHLELQDLDRVEADSAPQPDG